MYLFKRLLVGLNLTSLDSTVIRYAEMISRLSKSEKVHYLFVNRNSDIPDDVLNEYPNLLQTLDELAMQKMKHSVNKYGDKNVTLNSVMEVQDGLPIEKILTHSMQNEVDLIVVGRKKKPQQTRKLPVKLARKAPCSVLVLPYNAKAEITKILVPIDFSEYSADALDVAVAFASANHINNIICLHVYSLPLGYYKTGKSKDEFLDIMKKNAEKDFQQFIEGQNLKNINVTAQFKFDKNPARAIRKTVAQENIDLVAVGARGRTSSALILLSSITEQLIMQLNIPVIAVKKKGTGLTLLKVLLNL